MTAARPSDNSLARAFPFAEQVTAARALRALPAAELEPLGVVPSSNSHRYPPPRLGDSRLLIPYRIYNSAISLASIDEADRPYVAAIYTRHHDGHVRETALDAALHQYREWMAPFVVQLLGEYVVELASIIESWLVTSPDATVASLHRFTAANPGFTHVTRARSTSYWGEYYRAEYSQRAYPPLAALRTITGVWR